MSDHPKPWRQGFTPLGYERMFDANGSQIPWDVVEQEVNAPDGKYIWVLHNSRPELGRVGYYCTASHYSKEQIETYAKTQKVRVVMAIVESK